MVIEGGNCQLTVQRPEEHGFHYTARFELAEPFAKGRWWVILVPMWRSTRGGARPLILCAPVGTHNWKVHVATLTTPQTRDLLDKVHFSNSQLCYDRYAVDDKMSKTIYDFVFGHIKSRWSEVEKGKEPVFGLQYDMHKELLQHIRPGPLMKDLMFSTQFMPWVSKNSSHTKEQLAVIEKNWSVLQDKEYGVTYPQWRVAEDAKDLRSRTVRIDPPPIPLQRQQSSTEDVSLSRSKAGPAH